MFLHPSHLIVLILVHTERLKVEEAMLQGLRQEMQETPSVKDSGVKTGHKFLHLRVHDSPVL